MPRRVAPQQRGGEGVEILAAARGDGLARTAARTSWSIWRIVLTRACASSEPGAGTPWLALAYAAYCAASVTCVMFVLFHGKIVFEESSSWFVFVPLGLFGILTSLLVLLVSHRVAASYDRWWEARKHWGMIVNRTRDLARQSIGWVGTRDVTLTEAIVGWASAYAVAVKCHLRRYADGCWAEQYMSSVVGNKSTDCEIDRSCLRLGVRDLEAIDRAHHKPNAIMQRLTACIGSAHSAGCLSDIQAMHLDHNITQLEDEIGACERILRTPLPFAYIIQIRLVELAWLIFLPITLAELVGWYAIVASAFLGINLLSIESASVDVEDPFSLRMTALPLESIVDTIQNNLAELLNEWRSQQNLGPTNSAFACRGGVSAAYRSAAGRRHWEHAGSQGPADACASSLSVNRPSWVEGSTFHLHKNIAAGSLSAPASKVIAPLDRIEISADGSADDSYGSDSQIPMADIVRRLGQAGLLHAAPDGRFEGDQCRGS